MAIDYGNESLDRLEGAERIRTRPAAILGSEGLEGAKHTVREILGNALDEASSGFGDRIEISALPDGGIRIRDYGRGVPMGWSEKLQDWNWRVVFMDMYGGGKFKDSQAELKAIKDWSKFNPAKFHYLFSVGLNGLGSMASCATATYFRVLSIREGVGSFMSFTEGVNDFEDLVIEDYPDEANGTLIEWRPDSKVFSDANISESWLRQLAENTSRAASIDVVFYDIEGTATLFEAENISESIQDPQVISGPYLTHVVDAKDEVLVCLSTIAIGGASSTNGDRTYHNQVVVNGGVHTNAIEYAYKDFFAARGKESGTALVSTDWSGLLNIGISSQSNRVSYRGQTKDYLDDSYVYDNLYNHILNILRSEWAKKSAWLVDVVNKTLHAAEARLTVKELLAQVKQVEKVTKSRILPEKFVTCSAYTKKRFEDVELWLLEGNSASSSFRDARDSEFQCFLPLRGKGLNIIKATNTRILANEEILSLMQILACGIDLGIPGTDSFDLDKIRVGKIIIGSDADVDGWHIRILIFLIFYKLMPEILYSGMLYVAETPLYEVQLRGKEAQYAYSEKELRAIESREGGNISGVSRFKGLGQVDAEILRATTVAPETRNLVQIKIDRDDRGVEKAVEILFGDSTTVRKAAILEALLQGSYQAMLDDMVRMLDELEEVEDEIDLVHVEY